MNRLIVPGLTLLLIAGCGSSESAQWQSHGDRVLGLGSDKAQDPVSGAIVPKREAVRREFRGTMYFFESDETAAAFTDNPEEYALPPSGIGHGGSAGVR